MLLLYLTLSCHLIFRTKNLLKVNIVLVVANLIMQWQLVAAYFGRELLQFFGRTEASSSDSFFHLLVFFLL